MNALDIAFGLATVAAAVGGWRQGIIVRVATAAGAAGGVLLAAANVDWIAHKLPGARSAPRLVAVLTALCAGWMLGRLVGGLIGRWFRKRIPTKTLQKSDRMIGAMVAMVGVGISLYLAAPVLQLLPGWPQRMAQDSQMIRTLSNTVGLAPLPIDKDLWSQLAELSNTSKNVNAKKAGTQPALNKS